jgi:hypothetical protein
VGVKGRGSEARIILAPNLVREYILRIGTYVSGVSAQHICNALAAGCCTCAVHGSQHYRNCRHDLETEAMHAIQHLHQKMH